MKNWFAFMAAAMAAARADSHGYLAPDRTRSGPGKHGTSGAKLLRQCYESKNGKGHRRHRRVSYRDMADWYTKLLDGKYKAGHQRRITGQPAKF